MVWDMHDIGFVMGFSSIPRPILICCLCLRSSSLLLLFIHRACLFNVPIFLSYKLDELWRWDMGMSCLYTFFSFYTSVWVVNCLIPLHLEECSFLFSLFFVFELYPIWTSFLFSFMSLSNLFNYVRIIMKTFSIICIPREPTENKKVRSNAHPFNRCPGNQPGLSSIVLDLIQIFPGQGFRRTQGKCLLIV